MARTEPSHEPAASHWPHGKETVTPKPSTTGAPPSRRVDLDGHWVGITCSSLLVAWWCSSYAVLKLRGSTLELAPMATAAASRNEAIWRKTWSSIIEREEG